MAKYGSPDVTVNFDNTGGTPVDMSAYVTTIGNVDVEALSEEVTAMGVAWAEHLKTGLFSMPALDLSGPYDDTATTGPDAIFNSLGDIRTLQIIFGAAKAISVEALIKKYTRTIARGELTKFVVTLQPTGTAQEA